MKNIFTILFLIFSIISFSQSILSPSKNIVLDFKLSVDGKPFYSLKYKNKQIVSESFLGIHLKDGRKLTSDFKIVSTEYQTMIENWDPVLGEQKTILNEYNDQFA